MSETHQCAECGMHVEANEYHPYTACLIFKQTSSSKAVHMNLNAVLHEGGNRWRSVAEQAEKEIKGILCRGLHEWEDCASGYERMTNDIIKALAAFDSLRKEGT